MVKIILIALLAVYMKAGNNGGKAALTNNTQTKAAQDPEIAKNVLKFKNSIEKSINGLNNTIKCE